MNCPNCGAAMQLVGNRNHFRCSYCESLHFPEPLDEGLIATDEDHRLSCPRCDLLLKKGAIEGRKVAYCTQCRGFLTTGENFGVIVRKRREQRPAVTDTEPFDPAELRQVTTCPRCAQRMQTHPYGGGGAAVIDSCSPCDLVWLDAGELTILEQFTPPR